MNRREYLYDIPFWELYLISRGYTRRTREMWSAIRWQTFHLMLVSMADIKKAGINKPSDLMTFPWEEYHKISTSDLPTEDEIEQMRAEMRRYNKEHQKEIEAIQ